ncbi:MAG: carboxypeptidase-like regulatory domain-containing protein [Planctomycetales bacterium]|nr:carboxypeptidase-like regulatory domain-containing protein [Planctomycetales bacterium]
MAARNGLVLAGLVVVGAGAALYLATRPRDDGMDLLGASGSAAPAPAAPGTATAEGGTKAAPPGFADAGTKAAPGRIGAGDPDSAVVAASGQGSGARLPAGEVGARVVSARTEKPVGGVSVRLSRPGVEKGPEAMTAADGTVRLRGVPAAAWTLTASLAGYETLERPGLALGTDSGLDLGDLSLAPTPALRGLVRRPAPPLGAMGKGAPSSDASEFVPVVGAKVEVVNEVAFKFGPDTDLVAVMRDFVAAETVHARATTDASGRFALYWDELEPGPVAVRVAPTDRAVTFANVALEPGKVAEVTLTADPAARLAGQVVDHAGVGISGVPVAIASNPDDPTFFLSGGKFILNRMFTTSDTEGRFEFPSVRAGGYMVFAGGGRWPRTQTEGMAPSDSVRIEIPLALAVSGVVTDAKTSKPVAGADVVASGGHGFGVARTDEAGKYRIDGLSAAEGVRLTVKAPGYAPTVKAAPKGAKDEVTVNVEMTAGLTISGRVVAAKDGAPIAGASVFVFAGMGDFEMGGAPKATTDADGRFSLAGISPEGSRGMGRVEVNVSGGAPPPSRPTATLHVQAKGFVQAKKTTVELVPGEDPKGLEIRLDPAARVSGRVVDSSGKAVEGAGVKATKSFSPQAGNADPMDWFLMMGGDGGVKTGPDGSFALESVVPGPKVKLTATHDDYAKATSAPFEARAGAESKGLTLTLTRGGRILAQVLGPGGEPLEGAALTARRVTAWEERMEAAQAAGDAAAAREAARGAEEPEMDLAEMMGGGDRPQTSDGQGRVVFPRLAPGRYKVGAGGGMFGMRSGGGGPAGTAPPPEVTVTVEEGRDATATLQYRLALAISGVVLDETGAPVADAWVSAQPDGATIMIGTSGGSGRTDSAGRFKIEGVPEGEYRIHAWKQGVMPVEQVKAKAGASNVLVKLKKMPEGAVPVPVPEEDMGDG